MKRKKKIKATVNPTGIFREGIEPLKSQLNYFPEKWSVRAIL